MPEYKITPEQWATYKAVLRPANATDAQWEFFITECERRSLVPGVHVVFQIRKTKEWNPILQAKVDAEKVTLITTINALRLIAKRSGDFRGYGKTNYYYMSNGEVSPRESLIPLGFVPHAVSVELFHKDWLNNVLGVARYDAYVQTFKDGGKEYPTTMWRLRAEEQLAKCAEAAGLRMIAPEECGGLYIAEEFERESKAELESESTPEIVQPAPLPAPNVAPPVNQAPAEQPEKPKLFTETNRPDPAHETTIFPPVPKAAAPPVKNAPPARPSAPPVRSTPPPVPKPPQAAAAPHVAVPPVANRVPIVDEPVQESPAELREFSERVERDNTPAPVPAENPTPATPAPVSIAPVADLPKPQPTVAPVAAAAPTADGRCTPEQYADFTRNRASKIVRDKLDKHMKSAGPAVKDYLLRQSGKAKLEHMDAATFDRLLTELEKATPEEAVALVKGK